MATIKFPSEMPSASDVGGNDKLMISKDVSGEAFQVSFNDVKQYLEITDIELYPVQGGSSSGSATVIPNGPAGQNRKMDASPGWYSVDGVPVEATEGHVWKWFWNGTSWSLVDMGELPKGVEVVQELGASTSKSISQKGITDAIYNATTTYNVSAMKPLPEGEYYNDTTARAAVPVDVIKPGLVIEYLIPPVGALPSKVVKQIYRDNGYSLLDPRNWEYVMDFEKEPSILLTRATDLYYTTGYASDNGIVLANPELYQCSGYIKVEEGDRVIMQGGRGGSVYNDETLSSRIILGTGSVDHTVLPGYKYLVLNYRYTTQSSLENTFVAIIRNNEKIHLEQFIGEVYADLNKLAIKSNLPVLFDKNSKYFVGSTLNTSGVIGTLSNNSTRTDFIKVSPNTPISTTYLRILCEYDKNKNFIPGTAVQNQEVDIVTSPNTEYIMAVVFSDGGAAIDGVTSNILTARIIEGDRSDIAGNEVELLRTTNDRPITVDTSRIAYETESRLNKDRYIYNDRIDTLTERAKEADAVIDNLISLKSVESSEFTINVPPLDFDIDNSVIRLSLHHGSQRGLELWDEVFLDSKSREDFSDIRFEDENGNSLDFSIISRGNYDFIKEDLIEGGIPAHIFTLSDNSMVTSVSSRAKRSQDNGQTWEDLNLVGQLVFIDSNDNIYFSKNADNSLNRASLSDNFATPTIVHIFPSGVTVKGGNMAEDSEGNLYMGTYQASYHCEILKSTDQGQSWTRCYFNSVNQHVHYITIDRGVTPNAIYAGLDGAVDDIKSIKSTDGGATWSDLPIPYPNADYGIVYCGDGYRLGGGEAVNIPGGGVTIYKTKDDINFYPVLNTHQRIAKSIVKFGKYLFCGALAARTNRVTQIFASTDDGETWFTAFSENFSDTDSAGEGYRHFTEPFIPKGGTDLVSFATGNYDQPANPELAYKALRIFEGGDNYYATAYVRIGELKSAGRTIKLKTGYMVQYPERAVFKDLIKSDDVILRFRLDEGAGNVVREEKSRKIYEINGYPQWVPASSKRFGTMFPFYPRKVRDSGIIFKDRSFIKMDGLVFPEKNYTLIFWANVNNIPKNAMFFIGNPSGIHFVFRAGELNISDGVTYTSVSGISGSNKTDIWQQIAIVVSNDETPVASCYMGDNMTKSTTLPPLESTDPQPAIYLGNAGFLSQGSSSALSNYQNSLNIPFSDIVLIDGALSAKQIRDIYYGREYY